MEMEVWLGGVAEKLRASLLGGVPASEFDSEPPGPLFVIGVSRRRIPRKLRNERTSYALTLQPPPPADDASTCLAGAEWA